MEGKGGEALVTMPRRCAVVPTSPIHPNTRQTEPLDVFVSVTGENTCRKAVGNARRGLVAVLTRVDGADGVAAGRTVDVQSQDVHGHVYCTLWGHARVCQLDGGGGEVKGRAAHLIC